jgi:hypothetical protein
LRECGRRHACPHLRGRDCGEVLAENDRLKAENADLRSVFGTAAEAFEEKAARIRELEDEAEVLRRKLRNALSAPFNRATEEDGREEGKGEQEEVRPKKRGAPKGHRGATRRKPEREPDRIVEVRPAECPHCGSRNVSACRQREEHTQEDIVLVRPVATRFVKHRGYCKDCKRTFFPRGEGERPKGYIGPVAAAVAGYLRYAVKMPFASVRRIFGDLWGLPVTETALAGFDRRLARAGKPFYEKLGDLVRCSAGVNVDETSWPCGSATQWLWTFAGRDCAFFRIAPSRGGAVARDVLGENYGGILSSDCFSAYNTVQAKGKQKCLAHYRRAADDLEKFHPDDEAAKRFAASLKDLFKRAKITYGNNSPVGARNHETLMSLVETARLRNADPLKLMIALAEDNAAVAEKALFGGNTATERLQQPPAPS